MPSLDQLKDKEKFNGSDDPDSIPFATFLGLTTARCVQQDIGHVLVDTDPNQRTRRLVNVMEDDPVAKLIRLPEQFARLSSYPPSRSLSMLP